MTNAIILMIEETIRRLQPGQEPTMARHRFREQLTRSATLPPAPPALPTSGFMACPLVLGQGLPNHTRLVQEEVYRRAWEEARAVLRPSILERCAAALTN
jgi:hypothetical protein